MDQWNFVNFHKYSSSKRKVTRKKILLDRQKMDLYPAEGHASSSIVWENKHYHLYIGGASYTRPAAWDLTNMILVYTCDANQTDFWIENITVIDKFEGSNLDCLSQSAMAFDIFQHGGANFLLFGGVNLKTLLPTNDLYRLSINLSNMTCHLQLLMDKVPQDPMFKQAEGQSGDVPTPRLGHTLTKCEDGKWILPGGAYILIRKAQWTKIHIGDAVARAYHTATYLESRNCVILLGGVKETRNSD